MYHKLHIDSFSVNEHSFFSPPSFSAYATLYSIGLSFTILICVVADCFTPTVFANFTGHY